MYFLKFFILMFAKEECILYFTLSSSCVCFLNHYGESLTWLSCVCHQNREVYWQIVHWMIFVKNRAEESCVYIYIPVNQYYTVIFDLMFSLIPAYSYCPTHHIWTFLFVRVGLVFFNQSWSIAKFMLFGVEMSNEIYI